MKFTVLLTPDREDGGYVAECLAIPGCVSEGDTVEEALANIKEAIEGCLESAAVNHRPLPVDYSIIVATIDVDVKHAQAVSLVEEINVLKPNAKTKEDWERLNALYKELERIYSP